LLLILNITMKNISKWIFLAKTPDLGDASIKKLWDYFGSIDAILNANPNDLSKIEGLPKKGIKAFLELREEIKMVETKIPENIKVLTFEDENYPEILFQIHDPPPVIYYKGDFLKNFDKSIAIVGTRKASNYGINVARKIAFELSKLGIIIISGMALGIDTAAHEGALEAGGKTIAVLGCGVNVLYPPENIDLRDKIITSGAILSEFPLNDPVDNWKFPKRNRIVSGLSLGTIIIEGGYKSGAMITAKLALDQGREVFAVPGNIESELSKGPHWLIKQGAKLVEGVDDIIDEFQHIISLNQYKSLLPVKEIKKIEIQLSFEESNILKFISNEPMHIDEIVRRSELVISKVLITLSQLEIKKLVKQLPGKMFIIEKSSLYHMPNFC